MPNVGLPKASRVSSAARYPGKERITIRVIDPDWAAQYHDQIRSGKRSGIEQAYTRIKVTDTVASLG